MKAHNNGIEALATGDFNIRAGQGMKEVLGIIDGEEITLLWNTSGANPPWKKDAVAEYRRQSNIKARKEGKGNEENQNRLATHR